MKHTRILALIPAALLSLLVLASCATSSAPTKDYDASFYENQGDYEYGAGTGTVAESNSEEASVERKLIKNADIESESDNIEKSYDTIILWVKEHGGQEYSVNLSMSGSYKTIESVIKISPDKLDELIGVIGQNTSIINLKSSTEDITDKYYDAELRLKTKREALEQYYKMLDEAEGLDDILRLKNLIDELTTDIEVLEGKLKVWKGEISQSTITFRLYQKDDPDKPKKEVEFSAMSFGDMMTYIGNGFLSVVNVIIAVFQWLAIIAVSALPLCVIALIVILIIRKAAKRRKSKKEDEHKD